VGTALSAIGLAGSITAIFKDRPVAAPTPESAVPPVPEYDYEPWRLLPVNNGRTLAFETACTELVRQITGRERFAGHGAMELVLAWQHSGTDVSSPEASPWDHCALILCDHRDLRAAIYAHVTAGLEPEARDELLAGKRIAPADLRGSPGFDRLLTEVAGLRTAAGTKAHLRMSRQQLKAEQVGRRLLLYDAICGRAVTPLAAHVLAEGRLFDPQDFARADDEGPQPALERIARRLPRHPDPLGIAVLDAEGGDWLSLGDLRFSDSDAGRREQARVVRAAAASEQNTAESVGEFPRQRVRHLLDVWQALGTAYRSGDAERFAARSAAWFAALDAVSDAPRADERTLRLELAYHHIRPFRWAWALMLAAAALLAASCGWRWPGVYAAGLALMIGSLGFQAYGFAVRIWLTGRAPVGNLYETVVWAASAAALLALVLEVVYRPRLFALAGAAVATLGLLLADFLPLAFDPSLAPLTPELRTNFWLTVHVLTIVSAYAAGTLAWGLGNLTLGLLAFGHPDTERLRRVSQLTYRAVQVTVVLLAAGTMLGGWWAAEQWGRFWGWDPKEVGALVALLAYVAPLHARYAGWIADFGLAVAAVACYAAIIISWYVVNFVLAAGLHSYGFSDGGLPYVAAATALNGLWLCGTAWIWRRKSAAGALLEPVEATASR
jgi:ABC-type transport system involved in cytochrome c biogenesis permease subunit